LGGFKRISRGREAGWRKKGSDIPVPLAWVEHVRGQDVADYGDDVVPA
jgi:hypothetical protein